MVLSSWVEKAGRAGRWLLLHPHVGAAAFLLLLGAVVAAFLCSPPKPAPPGAPARGAADVLPATPESQSAAEHRASDLEAQNLRLRQQVKDLQAAEGSLRTIWVIDATTKGMRVKAPKRPAKSAPGQATPGDVTPQVPLFPTGTDRPVALYEGETLKLHLAAVGERVKRTGQLYIPISVDALTQDGQKLGSDGIDVPLSEAAETVRLTPPGGSWIVGGGPGASERGLLAAGLLASPRRMKVPLLPLRAGFALVGAGGVAGSRQGMGLVFVTLEHSSE